MGLSRSLLVLLAAGWPVAWGCHPHAHPGSHEAEDEQEERTIQVTVWESGHEAFVEYPYPVATVPALFATHISEISTGEPRRQGPVTFRLHGPSGETSEQIEERPARDGIYLASLTFPAAGVWRVVIQIPRGDGDARVPLPELTVHGTAEEAAAAPPPEETEGVSFLKEQQWILPMRTEPATRKTLRARRRLPGRVLPAPGRRVHVSASLSGRLLVPDDGAFCGLGRRVEAGQVLALVEPSLPGSEFLSLEIKLAEAEAEEIRAAHALRLATSTRVRVERLAKASAAPARELERARFEEEAARVAHEAAVAVKRRYQDARAFGESYRLRGDAAAGGLDPLRLRAPISGTIVRVGADPGERVTSDQELFVILDASTVWVEAHVPEYEAGRLEKDPAAYLDLPRSESGEARPPPLSPIYSGLEVDDRTRTVALVYEAENTGGLLRIGMSVDVLVESGRATGVVAIPESSLVDADGKYVAFVQVAGETFERRELKLGVRDSGLVEVLDGIGEGERVVVTDPWAIRLASMSAIVPAHGHSH